MKAAYFEEHGGLDVIQFGELPDPVAGAGEVVIDIHAASVNGADWKVREGAYKQVSYFPMYWVVIFPAQFAKSVTVSRTLRLVMKCLVSVMSGRKALIVKRSR